MMDKLPLILGCLLACGGQSGKDTIPASEPLGVLSHEKEVARHEAEAEGHRKQFKPDPNSLSRQCEDTRVSGIQYNTSDPFSAQRPCWSSDKNPTAWHLSEMSRHKKYAAQHRAKAKSLREAEQRACAGMGETAMSHSPFFHHSDIVEVSPYLQGGSLRGAKVYFRAVRGLTAEWLKQALTCQQARAAAIGYTAEFARANPLALPDAEFKVRHEGDRLEVIVSSKNAESAGRILGRAEGLRYAHRP